MHHQQMPELVQAEDRASPDSFSGSSTPLFLIHDGGGTTFAYHCLGHLHRFVYGIANPHFFTGARFSGGLPEMARLYAKWIRRAVARPDFPARTAADGSVDVLLGGWSLGGLLSLEVAKLLADDALVRVGGILMVDSVYPRKAELARGEAWPFQAADEGKTKNQIRAQRCMAEARRMVGEWTVPVWEGRSAGKRPKMVLLRATGRIPTTADSGISTLDVSRDDGMLGWGAYDETAFVEVVDVEGHHFDLFEQDRISATTAAMRRGLDRLEQSASLGEPSGG